MCSSVLVGVDAPSFSLVHAVSVLSSAPVGVDVPPVAAASVGSGELSFSNFFSSFCCLFFLSPIFLVCGGWRNYYFNQIQLLLLLLLLF